MRLIGLEIPRNQTKALRLSTSVDHTVSQPQEKSPPQKKTQREKRRRKNLTQSRLRPVAPFSYVGQGRKGAKVKRERVKGKEWINFIYSRLFASIRGDFSLSLMQPGADRRRKR
jgi:hypothetical protein